MARLLMISGDRTLAQGHRGAFYNTLQELHSHWEQINVITPPIGQHITRVFFGNVFVHASPWPLILQPLFIFKKGAQLHREANFDVMTVHEYPPFYNGIGAWLLHRKTGIPYVLEVMHFPGVPKAGNFKELIYHWLMRAFFRFDARHALKIRAINERQTPEYLKKSGISQDKIVYIPAFYIDLETFQPMQVEKKYDLLFAGRLVDNKGIFLFLDAVRLLPNVKACIVGDGPRKRAVRKYIQKHNLENRVHLQGWAPDHKAVAEMMNQSRLLVMPSYNEGGPRVVLEAMACGVPVLATSVGIIPDVVQDGISGLIIPWDAQKIAQVASYALGDSTLYERMRLHGLEIVRQFERSQAIEKYARAMQKLIS